MIASLHSRDNALKGMLLSGGATFLINITESNNFFTAAIHQEVLNIFRQLSIRGVNVKLVMFSK